jgi:hypothetical protein
MNQLKSPQVIARENLILERAIELLQSGWCQGAYAEDEYGEVLDAEEEDAVAWCATGSLMKAMLDLDFECTKTHINFVLDSPYYINTIQRIIAKLYQDGFSYDVDADSEHAFLACWNDHYAKSAEEVILVFKRALYE